MIVISNSSPLIALSRIYRLPLLEQLFLHIIIPTSVEQEIVRNCRNIRQKNHIETALKTFIESRSCQRHHIFSRSLGEGERGVLNLALDLSPTVLLLDDKRARNEAYELGLMPSFTSDVLKEAELQGLIPSYQKIMQELYAQEIYLAESS